MVRPAESTRQAIINAAVHLFAEKGFEGASVRDIITEAQCHCSKIGLAENANVIGKWQWGWCSVRVRQCTRADPFM